MEAKTPTGMVAVKFNRNYIASRGPGISGAKGDEKNFRMTDALKELIDSEVLTLIRKAPAAKRETADKKAK